MSWGRSLGYTAVVCLAVRAGGAPAARFDFAAEVMALRDVRVPAEVAGRVVARPENETAAVREGEVVVALDDVFLAAASRAARANASRAQATLEWAETELGRLTKLRESGTIGESEFDQIQLRFREARTQQMAAEALADEAERRLDRTKIRAPFAGKLVRVYPEEGEYLRIGDTAFRIIDDSSLRVISYVPADSVELLEVGAAVAIASAHPDSGLPALAGKVFSIAPAAEGRARTIRVEVRASDPSGRWRPGMTARLRSAGNGKGEGK